VDQLRGARVSPVAAIIILALADAVTVTAMLLVRRRAPRAATTATPSRSRASSRSPEAHTRYFWRSYSLLAFLS
jgi:hypothetical protein